MPFVRELQVKYVRRRVPENTLPETPISSPKEAARFFMHMLGNEPIERLVALFLNTSNEAVAYRQIAQGTVDHCAAYPAEIARGALLANAMSVVLGHNHPSGITDPSGEDVALSRKVHDTLKSLDLTLHDSIIVSDRSWTSLRETGLLPTT